MARRVPAASATSSWDTTDSLFHITDTDGILECGGDPAEASGEATRAHSHDRAAAGLDRATCQNVPYNLSVSDDGGLQAIAFEKLGGDSNQYRATIVWPVETSAYGTPATQIRYSNDDPRTIWSGAMAEPGSSARTVRRRTSMVPRVAHRRPRTSTGTGMQVTEVLFGQGDPGAWRTG